jgi:hypothetical protein
MMTTTKSRVARSLVRPVCVSFAGNAILSRIVVYSDGADQVQDRGEGEETITPSVMYQLADRRDGSRAIIPLSAVRALPIRMSHIYNEHVSLDIAAFSLRLLRRRPTQIRRA